MENGFGGRSIFFANNSILDDLDRAAQYARILSSVRINTVVVNNVSPLDVKIHEMCIGTAILTHSRSMPMRLHSNNGTLKASAESLMPSGLTVSSWDWH
jgi:hypothetical protein